MNKTISLVGVPMDLGQCRRGVDMGPSAIRYAGVKKRLQNLNHEIIDLGDIKVPSAREEKNALRNLSEVVLANQRLAKTVDNIVTKNSFPLVLGGDHSIAIGTLAGLYPHYNDLGVIWYDAHGDLNTEETSPSGNIHGMPLAASLGLGKTELTNIHYASPKIKSENIVLIGIRDLDEAEKELIKNLNIKIFTMHEVDLLGMPEVIAQTIDYLKDRTDGIHLSFDLDGIDPAEAPGVGTPVLGGLTYRESHLTMELLHNSGLITSAEFVEVNPMLDIKSQTAEIAVGLISSLLGEKLK